MPLLAMTPSHIGAPVYILATLTSILLPVMHQRAAQDEVLRPQHPPGTHGRRSWFLASAWQRPGYWQPLGD